MFLNEALKSGRNLVYDGTLTTVSSVDRLDKAIEANHSVVVIGVTCETHTSLMRAAERAKRIGRYVAACDLIDTHKKFSRRFMSYAAKRLKDIRLYDTSYNETLLVVQKDTVKNWTLFDKFTWKAIQTVDEVQRNLTGEWLDQYDQFHSLCGICKKTGSIGNVEQRPISEPSDKPTQKNSENSEKFPKIGDKESEIGKQQNAEGSSSKGEATKVTDLFINEWKMPLRA